MTYTHLSQSERYQIHALMKAGQTQATIAQVLGRHPSTISREIKRGSGLRGYRPGQAQSKAQERAQGSRNAAPVRDEVWQAAQAYLGLQWSPEQIASQLPISHETIYQRVYADKALGGHLWRALRCQKQRRKRYGGGRDRRGQIPHRRSISERPAGVEKRLHIGHWEGDTVIGAAHQQAIVTLVERKSGYAVIAKVERKTAEQVSAAIVDRLGPIATCVKTITYDNGKEFASHVAIDQCLGSTAYFADPFASWQRGTNENYNGLLRQYIPKKRHLSTVTQQELKEIEERLNHRPRKRLGWKSPHQVFHEALHSVALRT